MAPGNSCSVAVRFAPTGIDLRQATVGVADDAPGSPQGIAVSGYGRGPGSWTPTGSLRIGRDDAAATLLGNGDVLIAGGENKVSQGSLSDAELYDPSTGTFRKTGALNTARSFVTGALLADGDVLVAGGLSNVPTVLSSAELYDPATQSWSFTTPMNAASYGLRATVLSDGDVLVSGFGSSPPEVYDPVQRHLDRHRAAPCPGRGRHRRPSSATATCWRPVARPPPPPSTTPPPTSGTPPARW